MSAVGDWLFVLAAKHALRELTAKYCYAVVDGDVDADVALFRDDAKFHDGR